MMQAVSLKCSGCGGSLNVKPDIEELGCGYCGATLIVEREGGSVSFRRIHSAISKVQMGTDKTAAELAIVRLSGDIANAQQALIKVKGECRSEFEQRLIFYIIIGSVAAIFVGIIFGRYSLILGLLAAAAVTGLIGYHYVRNSATLESRHAARIAPYDKKLQGLRTQLEKNKRIANS